MRFEFDPIKDAANVVRHGVSLALAADLEWDGALALLGNRLYFVAFIDRGNVRRTISLRKANIREVNHYAAND